MKRPELKNGFMEETRYLVDAEAYMDLADIRLARLTAALKEIRSLNSVNPIIMDIVERALDETDKTASDMEGSSCGITST